MNKTQRDFLRQIVPVAFLAAVERDDLHCIDGPPAELKLEDPRLVSILGFKHPQLSGSLLIACDEAFLTATCPGLRSDEKNPKPFIYDWVGELINLTAGHFKDKLLDSELDINLNPPSISQANLQVLYTYANRIPSELFWFNHNGHTVCLVICAEIAEDWTFRSDEMQTPRVGPGEAMIHMSAMQSHGIFEEETTPEFETDQAPDQSLEFEPSESEPQLEESVDEYKSSELSIDSGVNQEIESAEDSTHTTNSNQGVIDLNANRIHRQDSESPSLELKPNEKNKLESIHTTRDHELIVQFSHGVVYTIPVAQVMDQGLESLSLEGETFRFFLLDHGRVVEVQGLKIEFRERVAA